MPLTSLVWHIAFCTLLVLSLLLFPPCSRQGANLQTLFRAHFSVFRRAAADGACGAQARRVRLGAGGDPDGAGRLRGGRRRVPQGENAP
eukprot:3459327-Pleurochrysis_carterae.AAC.1